MQEDLRCDVVRRADSRVGHETAGLAPSVDLVAVGHGEVDCVDHDRVAGTRVVLLFAGGIGAAFEETLVIVLVVRLVKTGREAEVRELDVAIFIDEDVVGFDITEDNKFPGPKTSGEGFRAHRWMNPNLWTASIAQTHCAM